MFLCFTERESTAKGVEVTQQGTALELPESFITSPVTVQTCLAYSGLLVAFNFLPHTCSSDNRSMFASRLTGWARDYLSCWNWRRLQGGLGSECKLCLFGLELAQDAAEPGQGLVYLTLWKSKTWIAEAASFLSLIYFEQWTWCSALAALKRKLPPWNNFYNIFHLWSTWKNVVFLQHSLDDAWPYSYSLWIIPHISFMLWPSPCGRLFL